MDLSSSRDDQWLDWIRLKCSWSPLNGILFSVYQTLLFLQSSNKKLPLSIKRTFDNLSATDQLNILSSPPPIFVYWVKLSWQVIENIQTVVYVLEMFEHKDKCSHIHHHTCCYPNTHNKFITGHKFKNKICFNHSKSPVPPLGSSTHTQSIRQDSCDRTNPVEH